MRRGGVLVVLAAIGVLAVADTGSGSVAAPNLNCGNPSIDYAQWNGPVGGREHERMLARLALWEQNSTCKHFAKAVVNCPPAEHNAPARIIGTGGARVPRKAHGFKIKASGRLKVGRRIYHGTPILVKAKFVGKSQYSHGRWLGPKALKVKLTADKCADPGPFSFTVKRRG